MTISRDFVICRVHQTLVWPWDSSVVNVQSAQYLHCGKLWMLVELVTVFYFAVLCIEIHN